MLRVPQMAERLVDEPVPFFDDFGLVEEEEEEEEEEQPRVVPELYFRGPLVDDRHIICPVDHSGDVHRQARAVQKYWPPWGLQWLTSL